MTGSPELLDRLGEPMALAFVGLGGGLALGLAARLGRLCALGAIEDALWGGDGTRMRMWIVAVGTAIVATQLLIAGGRLEPAATPHLGTGWLPHASVLGGLAFGYGMALAGNCGYGALARAGGGDLRSAVIVLVMAIAAYATLSGPLAPLRIALFPEMPTATLQGVPWLAERWLGLPPAAVGVALGAALLAAALWSPAMRARPGRVAWGAVAGLAVASGFAGTAWIAEAGFAADRPLSHSYAAPLGETLLYVMTASGGGMGFGVGSVAGVVLGATLGSLWSGGLRWEACDDPRELRRQIAGASLMGVGAVVALGCTVGQGLSAFALLSYSAPVTTASIFAGAALGLRQLLGGFAPAE